MPQNTHLPIIQESLKLKWNVLEKQNLKIYFKYKHIYYTGCVIYVIFTCLTTVQIFWKRQKTFLMQNHQLKHVITSDYTKIIVSILRDTTDSVTIKMIINQWVSDIRVVCSGGYLVDRCYVKMHYWNSSFHSLWSSSQWLCVQSNLCSPVKLIVTVCLAQKAGGGWGECGGVWKWRWWRSLSVYACVQEGYRLCVLVVMTVCLVLVPFRRQCK